MVPIMATVTTISPKVNPLLFLFILIMCLFLSFSLISTMKPVPLEMVLFIFLDQYHETCPMGKWYRFTVYAAVPGTQIGKSSLLYRSPFSAVMRSKEDDKVA